ncbi:calpain-type cysteine protease DEK1, partial [Tanacetum coccineum]
LDSTNDVGYRREMCAHARILALEEAILFFASLSGRGRGSFKIFLISIGVFRLSEEEGRGAEKQRIRIRANQLSRRSIQGISGAVCVLDDEPVTSGRYCGQLDPTICRSQKVTFSMAVIDRPESGPVCLLGTEFQKQVCWEILVAGPEQGIEAGQVGLRLITKGDRQSTVCKEWNIGAACIADGRWHTVTVTIDAELGEAACFLDGGFDGYQTELPLRIGNGIWDQGTEVWVGVRPPTDVDMFGRSDCEGTESKMHIMDLFLWGRCLLEDEISALPAAMGTTEYNMFDLPEDNWQWTDSPPRVDEWDSDPAEGEWVPVVIDDWVPCESPGKPAFATSKKGNELWVSLLEKAYAKLHGSYEALEGGLVQDALVDLTGGAGEEIDMRSAQAQIDLASGRLWSQLLRFKQEGFLLGAGSPSGSDVHISSSGIVQGHAYSLLQVREVDGHKLVQIRNPWANEVEWNGPWSDSSPEWTDRMKHKLKHVPQAKSEWYILDGHRHDFQIISGLYTYDYERWHQKNPQFRIRATGSDASCPIHVFITLTQGVSFSRTTAGFRNYQSSHDSMMFYIGMRIIKTRGRRASYNIYLHESVGGTDYVNSREISCEMVLEPDPRGYTIVPTTIHPGEEAPFVLSVFTKSSITLEAL